VLVWVLAGLGLLLSATALALVRRLSRRLDALNKSYWELRYDYTRLRSRLSRLDPEDTPAAGPEASSSEAPPGAAAGGPSVTFVPLSTIRKKEK
jgi:hypothetical protein